MWEFMNKLNCRNLFILKQVLSWVNLLLLYVGQVQQRFENLKKRKDPGTFTEQGTSSWNKLDCDLCSRVLLLCWNSHFMFKGDSVNPWTFGWVDSGNCYLLQIDLVNIINSLKRKQVKWAECIKGHPKCVLNS